MLSENSILLLNARRRLPIARALRQKLKSYGFGSVVACDKNYDDPIRYEADAFFIFPGLHVKNDVADLITEMKRRGCRYVIPWIDNDIWNLALQAELLRREGITCLIPPFEFVQSFHDKYLADIWLEKSGFTIPKRVSRDSPTLPFVAKLRFGQGALDQRIIETEAQAQAFDEIWSSDYLCQEFIDGEEFTIDLVVSPVRTLFCAVPRRRVKIRAGEVLVSEITLDPLLLEWASEFAKSLNFIGIINVQIIRSGGKIYVIDINPRFGGGHELAVAAGVDISSYMLEILRYGQVVSPRPKIYNGLVMTRYLEAKFFFRDNPINIW